ncbi:MAG TPA: signal peptidase II [Polyangiaceae bacterium]|nr:signal peptidase II [Polyangiaceae bacterium]
MTSALADGDLPQLFTRRLPLLLPTITASGVVLADVLSKRWADASLSQRSFLAPSVEIVKDHLNLTLAYNRGGAWGLLESGAESVRSIFFAAVACILMGLFVWLHGKLESHQRFASYGMGFLLGGQLGNTIDRIVGTSVLDFIDYRADWILHANAAVEKLVPKWGLTDHAPTFNVADMAIWLGIAGIVIGLNAPPNFGVQLPAFWPIRTLRSTLGLALRWCALTIFLALLLFNQLLAGLADKDAAFGLLALLLTLGGNFLFVSALAKLWHLGRRYSLATDAELRLFDRRPPVLFLRTFAIDDYTIGARNRIWIWLPLTRVSVAAYAPRTFEDALVGLLTTLGPPVALGRPGEKLPAVGAARSYVSDSEWQARISALIGEASLVVIVPADSPALHWEIDAVRAAKPRKVLFVLPPGGKHGRSAQRSADFALEWSNLRARFSFFPEVNDRTAAVEFASGMARTIQGKSAKAWHILDTVERYLDSLAVADEGRTAPTTAGPSSSPAETLAAKSV